LSLCFPVYPQYIEVKDALDSKAKYAGELVGWKSLKLTRIVCSPRVVIVAFFGAIVGSENLSAILVVRATEEQKRKGWK